MSADDAARHEGYAADNLGKAVGDHPAAKVQALAAFAGASSLLAISHRLADLTDAIRAQGGES